jgi:serine protease
VQSGGTGSAFANCPVGYSAVGGGVDVSSPGTMKVSASAPTFQTQFLIERPAGNNPAPTGWAGGIRSEGPAGQMKVAAICAQLTGVFSVSSGQFSIAAGTVSGLSAQCPAGTILLGGGIDSNEVRRNAVAVSTALFGSNPQFPVDRQSGSYSDATGWYGIYYNYGPGSTTGAVAAVCANPSPNVVVVFEFYNTNLKHFFRTADPAEANAIDHGSAGPGWMRTGDDFLAYLAQSNSPGQDVCRFYNPVANTHFYTAFASECASLKQPNSGWRYEGLSFRIQLPGNTACPADTHPVYRLYNNRFQFNDSNHRFTTSAAQAQSLQQQGWTLEGVAFCAIGP